jgi:hypothetical protein
VCPETIHVETQTKISELIADKIANVINPWFAQRTNATMTVHDVNDPISRSRICGNNDRDSSTIMFEAWTVSAKRRITKVANTTITEVVDIEGQTAVSNNPPHAKSASEPAPET